MITGRSRLVLCVLMPLLCLTGSTVQLCFCHGHDEGAGDRHSGHGHSGHEHSGQASETASPHGHDHHSDRDHDSSHGYGSLELDPACYCFTLSPAPANTKGVERFTQKRDSKPVKLVASSPTAPVTRSHSSVRTGPATAGGGHSPPCHLFALYCSLLI